MSFERRGKDVTAFFDRLGLSAETYREFPTQRIPEVSLAPHTAVQAAPEASMPHGPAVEPLHLLNRASAFAASSDKRWSALNSLSMGTSEVSWVVQSTPTKVAFFSLAGGVGKTTLVTSIARILSGRSVQTVLVNCSHTFAIAHYLPEKTSRFGPLSFLHAPSGERGIPVTVIDASPCDLGREHSEGQTALLTKQATCQADIVLFDMPVTLDPASREVLLGADHIVIPLAPDLQSAASIGHLESLPQFQHGTRPQVHYILNRYDDSSSFQREVRARMEKVLGSRLHIVAIREDRLMQEASASGMTIADYAPEAAVIRDLHSVAEWVGHLSSRPVSVVPERASEEVA